jgi:hypothetical protein
LDIPITKLSFSPMTVVQADFQSGERVTVQSSGALTGYGEQLQKYPYLLNSWDLPSPIPEDLLLPFRDFVAKYNLQAEAFSVFSGGRGFTNLLDQLTVNVMKMVGLSYLSARAGAAIAPASGLNDEIYTKALARLGSDALLSSRVVAALRNSGRGVRLVVETPSGRKLIKASKLLISIPPLLDNCTQVHLFRVYSFIPLSQITIILLTPY